jgi:isopentenyl-diphosphate delta-isomerase
MGFDCSLEEKFHFVYKAAFINGLTEYEFDRVFFGCYDGEVLPDPEEVSNFKRMDVEELKNEIAGNPENFAEWFRILMDEAEL